MAIPSNIIVGVVDRDDTYTGKLGFVTYPKNKKGELQHKGVMGWMGRNKSTHPLLHFENVPTEGFVLNKKVGGRKPHYGEYKGRTVKARVYDPRGFEFEIDMENLCHILEHNGSTPGKALEGEFVFAWLGSGGVFLLSCKSEIYKNSLKSTKGSETNFITDFIVGKYYETSKGTKVRYMGEFNRFNKSSYYLDSIQKKTKVFINMTESYVRIPKLCFQKDIVKEITMEDKKQYDFNSVGFGGNYNDVYLSQYTNLTTKKLPISFQNDKLSVKYPNHTLNTYYNSKNRFRMVGSHKNLGLNKDNLILVETDKKNVYGVGRFEISDPSNGRMSPQQKLNETLIKLNSNSIYSIYLFDDFVKFDDVDGGIFPSKTVKDKDIKLLDSVYELLITKNLFIP